jgi:hypothetical protein
VAALLLEVASLQLLSRHPPAGSTAGATLTAAGLFQFLFSFVRQPGETTFLNLDLLQVAAAAMILAGCALLTRTFLLTERQ